jgi:hypothetical protein
LKYAIDKYKKSLANMSKIVIWYRYENFWRRGDGDGNELPTDRGDGTGDLIWNTLTKILMDREISEWSIKAFFDCADLLIQRKRYPKEFLVGKETPNMIVFWWKSLIKKENVLKPQGRMSRDPFIALGSLYAFFMKEIDDKGDRYRIHSKFLEVKIPLHLRYSISTMNWWRKLKFDDREHYVIRLDYIKSLGTQFTFEKKYEDKFYQDITK